MPKRYIKLPDGSIIETGGAPVDSTLSIEGAAADAKAVGEKVYEITKSIPAKTSDIQNDSGFVNNTVSNLTNYYLKSETYTREEVTALIAAVKTYTVSVVSELPSTGAEKVIYLVVKEDGSDGDAHSEYLWVNGEFEFIGTTAVDLTGYATETWVNARLTDFVTAAKIAELLGYTPANQADVDALESAIVDGYVPKNQGAANVGKILVVGTDGNLTLTDMPEGGVSGDVIGTLDEDNNILLTGALADGTYTLKYVLVDEQGNESYTDIGTLEVGVITPTQYSITNILANCTTSNNAQTIDHGANYSATITKDDAFTGHTAIYVTMGGVDISAEAVSGDNINVESVTGDIIISCVAYKANTRYSLSSFAETTSNASGLELTGYIPFKYGDTIYMKGVTIDADSTTQTMVWVDSNFEKISIDITAYSGTYTGTVFGDVAGEVKSLTLNRSTVIIDTFIESAGIAYIRISAAEINANSIITVNQPIE